MEVGVFCFTHLVKASNKLLISGFISGDGITDLTIFYLEKCDSSTRDKNIRSI